MAAFHIETVIQWLFLLTALNWKVIHAIDTYYMDDHCDRSIDLSMQNVGSMKLKLTSRNHYLPNMDCTLTIKTSQSKRLMHFFKNFDVDYSCNDWLEVYDNAYNSLHIYGTTKHCGWQDTGQVYESTSNSIILRFQSDKYTEGDGFTMILTPFHLGNCYSDEYRCHNSRCIKESSTCNGYNPCGDYSDCYLRGGAIAGIVIASVAVLTATIVTVVCCIKRRRTAIKRQNVQVPAQMIYPTGQTVQTVIHTHASYPGTYVNNIGAQVGSPGYTNYAYSGATSTYPSTVPPPYSEHKFSN